MKNGRKNVIENTRREKKEILRRRCKINGCWARYLDINGFGFGFGIVIRIIVELSPHAKKSIIGIIIRAYSK